MPSIYLLSSRGVQQFNKGKMMDQRKKRGYFSFRTMPSTDRQFRAVSQQVNMTCSALANMLVIDFVNRNLISLPGGRADHACRSNHQLDEMFGRVVGLNYNEELKMPVSLDNGSDREDFHEE